MILRNGCGMNVVFHLKDGNGAAIQNPGRVGVVGLAGN